MATKRRKGDDYLSDDSSDGEPKPKKRSSKSADSDGVTVCELSKNRKVAVRMWQGKVTVDIREFYIKDGKQMPGKKGILLSLDQWDVLRNHIKEVDKAIARGS